MDKPALAHAQYPLEGRVGGSALVAITPAGPASRAVLRARDDAIGSLSKVLGVTLPQKPKTSATSTARKSAGRRALWIGPDEWLLIDDGAADLAAACKNAAGTYSLVDVSNRNTAIIVSGKAAQATINAGCPQDLSLTAFPVGACSRTLLGKTEIILLREAEDVFRVEVWRSFSDYAFAFLSEAGRAPAI
ncbi:MAG: sarcosine oxidase subunit gamma family protein [Pseudomonadota bacterium]